MIMIVPFALLLLTYVCLVGLVTSFVLYPAYLFYLTKEHILLTFHFSTRSFGEYVGMEKAGPITQIR